MNPFTQSLIVRIGDPHLAEFVRHWDALEALIVRVYRSGRLSPADQREHRRLRDWLRRNYRQWRRGLGPHWRRTRIAGQATASDPFESLLDPRSPASFIDNWPAMQTLPAAREALNQLLLDRLSHKED